MADAAVAALAAARLLPFRGISAVLLDADHLAEAECRALQHPHHAAHRLSPDTQALCRPVDGDELPDLDLEHDAGRGRLDCDLAGARDHAGLSAGPDAVRRRRP